jgi:hypothetical protein
VRANTVEKGKQLDQVDVRYAPDPAAGWMPASCDVVSNAYGGRVLKTRRATVLECVVNPQLRRADFDLAFPPGTKVKDLLKRKDYTVPGSPDPEAPPSLLTGEVTDPREGSARPEPGQAHPWPWTVIGLTFVVVISLFATYVVYRRIHTRRGVMLKRP